MSGENRDYPANRTGLWVSGTLVSFALILAIAPRPFSSPLPSTTIVPDWATDPSPLRRPAPEPACRTAAFVYACSDCHRIIPPRSEQRFRTTIQHREVVLEHGINTRCLNCHHPTNRDAFVDDSGGEIPWDQPQRLCAKCHGPVYRDWQHGSHGRTNGYWDKTRGPQIRRKCIECHDPHRPPFPSLEPAPGPNTLRMAQAGHIEHSQSHNPLQLSRKAGSSDGVVLEEGH